VKDKLIWGAGAELRSVERGEKRGKKKGSLKRGAGLIHIRRGRGKYFRESEWRNGGGEERFSRKTNPSQRRKRTKGKEKHSPFERENSLEVASKEVDQE